MKGDARKLGNAELAIMQAIWRTGRPVTAGYIREQIKEERAWALSALMTAADRACAAKASLSCDKSGRGSLYSAKGQEHRQARDSLEKLYSSSASSLVTTLYGSRVIGKEELEELRRLIGEMEEARHGSANGQTCRRT